MDGKIKRKDKLIYSIAQQNNLSRKLSTTQGVVETVGIEPPKRSLSSSQGKPTVPTTHSSYHNYKTKYIIGCIANFYKNKGLEYLIKAVSRLQLTAYNLQLVITGDGAERENLERLIKELKLESHVILTGKIKNAHQYLRAFDIFILPSIKEGQPWVILEAMAAGLPIIATNIAAIPEMIQNKKNGLLVEQKNPQAIAEKIEYLIKNPKISENLGQNARQTIEQKFTINKMIKETEKLY